MYLSSVHVVNFRNLVDVTAHFKPGLNVLLGENNIGKSNLVDAIRAALNTSATGGDFVGLTKDDRHRLPSGTFVAAPIRVSLTFSALSHDEQAEFLDALNYNAASPADSTATIQCEWSLSTARDRWSFRRWGSARREAEGSIPDEAVQALPITFLHALRDAARALAPGRQSRLARLLGATAEPTDRQRVERISNVANKRLQRTKLVCEAEAGIGSILRDAAGLDLLRDTVVRATPNDFERVIQTLRVLLRPLGGGTAAEAAIEELASNGLGYNNLIYIATVLAELEARKDAALPLLLLEEPEAHLHPQLQVLLASYLATHGKSPAVVTSANSGGTAPPGLEGATRVQSIVTSHSPTIAAHVNPSQLAVMHRGVAEPDPAKPEEPPPVRTWVTRIDSCGLDDPQTNQLRRLLDATKASMLFAQGVILVEGVSEVMLFPVLAKRLKIDLEKRGVSLVPVGGVDFGTIARLFGAGKLRTPLAMVTDADPKIRVSSDDWRTSEPERDAATSKPVPSQRAEGLLKTFHGVQTPVVRVADLTLEYDLAAAGDGNSLIMYDAWESLYTTRPRNLTRDELVALQTREARALQFWRAVCCGSPSHGKAELAQELARRLDPSVSANAAFVVPQYIEDALRHAARVPRRP